MYGPVSIEEDECIGCARCASVCIRNTIVMEDGTAKIIPGNCFRCYQCYAVCPKGAIHIEGWEKNEPCGDPQISGNDMLALLKERRSVRRFTNEKISRDEFSGLLEAARYSPTANNAQDVEFAVVDDRLDDFMRLVYDVLSPARDTFGPLKGRVEQFCTYVETGRKSTWGHPLLWGGKQVLLTFAGNTADAYLAMARVELTGYAMGIGGFYSHFIQTAAELSPDLFSAFFPEIPENRKLKCVYVLGHPAVKYKRAVPPRDVSIRYY